MRKLVPTHVVFEGKVGALTGKNALQAKVGETALIVHSQANRDSRPHLIGGHGDYVWETGSFHNPPEGPQTWFIRGGSAGAALYTFRQPGVYAYLNHMLVEAVELGALAHFKVEGQWNDDLMKQVSPPQPIVAVEVPQDKIELTCRLTTNWSRKPVSEGIDDNARAQVAIGHDSRVLAVSSGVASASTLIPYAARLDSFETVDVAPRVFSYRLAGDFSQAGQSVDAPLVAVVRASVLHIMKQQVTVADYDHCVAETKCMARAPLLGFDPSLPAVQVSWQDAAAYATWLSAKTGETWRLPTDEE
jgi:hypothetical protein